MEKKDKKSNESKELIPMDVAEIDPDIEEVVSNVIEQKKGSRKHKFHLYRMFNLPIRTCAILAGYNKDYGYKLVAEYQNTPEIQRTIEKIINNMPEAYRSVCKMRLVQIAEIEGRAMTEYKDNPKLAIDKPQLLKQVKQGGGVLSDDEKPAPTFINIEYIRNMLRQVCEAPKKETPKIELEVD